MAKHLTLIRHAKSSWDDSGLQDFERPLNGRGLKNAPMMGKRLAAAGYTFDTIISSPAVRAITTAKLIAAEIGFDENSILQIHSLYAAGLGTLVDVVREIDNRFQDAILVGHNPGFTQLCRYLSQTRILNMPTCCIARIEFDAQSWETAAIQKGHLANFDYPRKA